MTLTKFAAALLCCSLARVLCAQASQPVTGPTGFRWTGADAAVVWDDAAQGFQLWRLSLGDKPMWTDYPVPRALTQLKARNPESQDDYGSGKVIVTHDFGKLHLLWTEMLDCNDDNPKPCTLIIHQAEAGIGNGWRLSTSEIHDDGLVDSILQVIMVDAQHGWMLLSGDPGAGQLPEEIATTSDGATWKLTAAKDAPIGRNRPQLLMPRSATEAWMTMVDYDDDAPPILMSHTNDGGRTWKADKTFPGGPNELRCVTYCMFDQLSRPDNEFHPGKECFEGIVEQRNGPPDYAVNAWKQVRYCTTPDGHQWEKPVALPQVLPAATPVADSREELPVFADRNLGFKETSRGVFETTNGGMTWQESAPLDASSNFGKDLTVKQTAATGDKVLLLLSGPNDDTKNNKLLYSADRGTTWTTLRPQR
jgi:hypothetical protein